MDLELKDKTALVLGAGGGLGGAIARTLGQEGAKVAVADVNYDAAKNTTADITANGGNAISLAWDIADLTVRGGDKVFHWSGGDLRPRRSKIQPVVRRSFVLWTKGSRRDVCRGSLRGGSAICFQ